MPTSLAYYQVDQYCGIHSEGTLQALLTNIRLGLKCLIMSNTPAYYKLITFWGSTLRVCTKPCLQILDKVESVCNDKHSSLLQIDHLLGFHSEGMHKALPYKYWTRLKVCDNDKHTILLQIDNLLGFHSEGVLQTFPSNIRQGGKCLIMTNTPAYYKLITYWGSTLRVCTKPCPTSIRLGLKC